MGTARVAAKEKNDLRITWDDPVAPLGKGETVIITSKKPLPKPIVREPGSIVAVGNGIASVNLGSEDGVEKDVELVIRRGPKFVGFLRIGEVDVHNSAGIIFGQALDVKPGDRVAPRGTLNQR